MTLKAEINYTAHPRQPFSSTPQGGSVPGIVPWLKTFLVRSHTLASHAVEEIFRAVEVLS